LGVENEKRRDDHEGYHEPHHTFIVLFTSRAFHTNSQSELPLSLLPNSPFPLSIFLSILSLSPNLFTHLRTDISSFFTSTPPLLYHAHLCMYSSHVTVFGSLFFLNKICLHMVIRSSTRSIFTCVLI
jgi:hypothetical protein